MTERVGEKITPEVREILDFEHRENAKAIILKSGLFFPSRPKIPADLQDEHGNIQLPNDVTAITDRDLGKYLSIFTALSSYAEGVTAVADIDWTVADRVATFAERLEILKLPKELLKNDDLRYGSVSKLEYVRKLRQKEMECLATFKLSSGMLRSYEKAVASLSREITRRSNMNRFEGYADNLDNRGQADGKSSYSTR